MKKHRIRRVAKAIKTGLTKVGLRKAKGLGDLSDEFLSPEPAASEDAEAAILNRALKNLTKIPLEELENNPAYRDPGQKAVGDTVYIPFIGSETEERGLDVKTTAYTIPQYEKLQRLAKQRTTCERCLGHKIIGRDKKCPACGGKGWRKARPGDDR
jgi:hypothetical protein